MLVLGQQQLLLGLNSVCTQPPPKVRNHQDRERLVCGFFPVVLIISIQHQTLTTNTTDQQPAEHPEKYRVIQDFCI